MIRSDLKRRRLVFEDRPQQQEQQQEDEFLIQLSGWKKSVEFDMTSLSQQPNENLSVYTICYHSLHILIWAVFESSTGY